MRLLVTGASGQVGWELSRSLMPLGEVVALDHRQCDFSRPELLPSLIRSIKPDIIVNAADYTAVDKTEREEKLATTVNGTAVGVFAEESRKAGILLVHYSTDYVFDGRSVRAVSRRKAVRVRRQGRSGASARPCGERGLAPSRRVRREPLSERPSVWGGRPLDLRLRRPARPVAL